jgi:hypothetical protein
MRLFVGPEMAKSVLAMRMFNVLVAAALLYLAMLVASPVVRRALTASWAIGIIPVGLYFLASVNPSSWAIAAGGTLWVFVLSVLQEGTVRSRRSLLAVIGASISIILALSARYDQALVVGVSVVAVVVLTFRPKVKWGFRVAVTSSLTLAAGVASALYLAQYLQQRRLMIPRGNAEYDQPNPLVRLLTEFPSFLAGHFGYTPAWRALPEQDFAGTEGWVNRSFVYGLGSYDISVPSLVSVATLLSVGMALGLGLAFRSRRKIAALSVVAVAIVSVVVLQRALTNWGSPDDADGFIWFLHPRYTMPLMLLGLGLLLYVPPAGRPLFSRIHVWLLSGLLTLAAVTTQLAIITRYSSGEGAAWMTLTWPNGWWWESGPSPQVLVIAGTLMSIVFFSRMLSVGEIANSSRDDEPGYEEANQH